MSLGEQFEQLQLFPTQPSTPAAEPAVAEESTSTVEDRIKKNNPKAVDAVQRAPKRFKYDGPQLYHGTSSDLGVGDIIYPTGVDLRPNGGSGSGWDLVGDVERHGTSVAYATPDYEDAAGYSQIQGGEQGTAKSEQMRLFHSVLKVEPLGKVVRRTYSNTGVQGLYGGEPEHRSGASEEVGSPHGYKVTGIAGYVINPNVVSRNEGESRADVAEKMFATPKVNSTQFAEQTVTGGTTWGKLYSKSSLGTTALEREAQGRRSADARHTQMSDRIEDQLDKNSNYRAPQKTYDKLNELYKKAWPDDEDGYDAYEEIHGEKPPWAAQEG